MSKKRLIYDLDETLCTKKQPGETYLDVKPIQPMIDQLNKFYDEGYEIIISTARNMVTQNNHVSKVVQNVGLDTMNWLQIHNVKYHGLQWGKEYGEAYIDDKSLRPQELMGLCKINAFDNLKEYLKNENDLSIINKSISYLLNDNKHYVYQWFYFKDNKKIVFYVGKGTKFRAWDVKTRNDVFKETLKNHQCEVEIVGVFEINSEAIQFETQLKYKYIDEGQCTACLDDIRGRTSPMKGRPAWNRSKNYVPKQKHPMGKKQPKSKEHKDKIKQSNVGKHNHYGSNNPNSALNEDKVKQICDLLNNKIHPKDIAQQFNVSEVTIHRIKGRKSWANVSNKYLREK